jgi:hypothetical protein
VLHAFFKKCYYAYSYNEVINSRCPLKRTYKLPTFEDLRIQPQEYPFRLITPIFHSSDQIIRKPIAGSNLKVLGPYNTKHRQIKSLCSAKRKVKTLTSLLQTGRCLTRKGHQANPFRPDRLKENRKHALSSLCTTHKFLFLDVHHKQHDGAAKITTAFALNSQTDSV